MLRIEGDDGELEIRFLLSCSTVKTDHIVDESVPFRPEKGDEDGNSHSSQYSVLSSQGKREKYKFMGEISLYFMRMQVIFQHTDS